MQLYFVRKCQAFYRSCILTRHNVCLNVAYEANGSQSLMAWIVKRSAGSYLFIYLLFIYLTLFIHG